MDAVEQIFTKIARKYDLLNTLISLGLHNWIRRKAVSIAIGKRDNLNILDCGVGTGSLMIEIYRYIGGNCFLIGIDISEKMMEVCSKKLSSNGIKAKLMLGDCHNLPFHDNTFDLVGCAWVIRNLENVSEALEEMVRVLKPQGKLLIIESGRPHGPLKLFYYIWLFVFIPLFGLLFASNYKAYFYYADSVKSFYTGQEFKKLLEEKKLFSSVELKYLIPGLCWCIAATVKK